MARETTLTLVVQAKNATKRALAGAERGIKGFTTRARSRFRRMREAIFSVRGAMAAIAGAGALAALAKKTFELGSEVEETASKYRTTFGPAVAEVNEFLDEFAHKAGLSQSEARELTATTGAMLRGMGNTREEAAALSEQVVRLAGDMTSFNNVPIEETIRAVNAAITGEREQLKRLGIVIRESDVQQRALAQSGKEAADALTQEEKAAATLTLITERMGPALGDLNRTQDSAANRARRVAAEFRSLKETMATALLPVLEEALNLIDRLNIVEFAAAVETDMGQAFFNLGLVVGAKLGEGIFRGLEKVLRETNVFAKIPGPVGGFFDRINIAAAGAGKVADIARDSAEQASEAITILAEAGGNLDELTAQLKRARERLARARSGEGSGGGFDRPGFLDEPVTPTGTGRPGQARSEGGGFLVGPNLEEATAEGQKGLRGVLDEAKAVDQAFQDFGQSAKQAFAGALQGALLASEGMKRGFLGAIAKMAAAKASFYAAEAIAAVARGLLFNDPKAFAAAGQYAKAAAAMGAVAATVGGAAAALSGGGGGPGAAARSGAQAQRDQAGQSRQQTTIIIKGSGLLNLNDPQQRRDLERALSGAGSLGNVNIVSG